VQEWMENAGDEGRDEYAIAFYNSIRDQSMGQQYEIPQYSESNMIDVLTQCFFVVTAYHELVGYIVDFSINAGRGAFRASELGIPRTDLQSFLISNVIISTTTVPMPQLMDPFDNWFGVPEGEAPTWERRVWNTFLARLEEQSTVVRSADAERINRSLQHEFPYFDPANLESSVSL